MYAKTNPRAVRTSPRQKRIFAVVAVIVVVVFGGLAAWGMVAHDSYGASGHDEHVRVPQSPRTPHRHHSSLPAVPGVGSVCPRPHIAGAVWPRPRAISVITKDLVLVAVPNPSRS